MDIEYTDKAFNDLKKITRANKEIAGIIVKKIERYASNPTGKHDVKKLKNKKYLIYRLRSGDYRILFTVENDTMIIATIKSRQDAYHD